MFILAHHVAIMGYTISHEAAFVILAGITCILVTGYIAFHKPRPGKHLNDAA